MKCRIMDRIFVAVSMQWILKSAEWSPWSSNLWLYCYFYAYQYIRGDGKGTQQFHKNMKEKQGAPQTAQKNNTISPSLK